MQLSRTDEQGQNTWEVKVGEIGSRLSSTCYRGAKFWTHGNGRPLYYRETIYSLSGGSLLKRMSKLIVLVIGFLLSNCSLTDPDFMVSAAGPDSIKVESISGASVTFTAYSTVGDPCWTLSNLEQSRAGNNVSLKIFVKRDPKAICATVVSKLPIPIFLDLGTPGTYNFSFWRSDTSSLDTTIIIN